MASRWVAREIHDKIRERSASPRPHPAQAPAASVDLDEFRGDAPGTAISRANSLDGSRAAAWWSGDMARRPPRRFRRPRVTPPDGSSKAQHEIPHWPSRIPHSGRRRFLFDSDYEPTGLHPARPLVARRVRPPPEINPATAGPASFGPTRGPRSEVSRACPCPLESELVTVQSALPGEPRGGPVLERAPARR